MDEPARLEAEYRSADGVLLTLVALEVRRAAACESRFDLPAENLVQVAVAINEAFAKVLRWRAGQSSALGLVARQAVAEAVAAESVRQSFPVAAPSWSGRGGPPSTSGPGCVSSGRRPRKSRCGCCRAGGCRWRICRP